MNERTFSGSTFSILSPLSFEEFSPISIGNEKEKKVKANKEKIMCSLWSQSSLTPLSLPLHSYYSIDILTAKFGKSIVAHAVSWDSLGYGLKKNFTSCLRKEFLYPALNGLSNFLFYFFDVVKQSFLCTLHHDYNYCITSCFAFEMNLCFQLWMALAIFSLMFFNKVFPSIFWFSNPKHN